MALTKAELAEYNYLKDKSANKKFKNEEKLDDKLYEVFNKLNNSKCYAHFDDTENRSFQNLLIFLTLLQKKCEKFYGKEKKYSKDQVESVLINLFPEPTKAQRKTIEKINKTIKKNKKDIPEFEEFKFSGIIEGKKFQTYADDYDNWRDSLDF
jgi:hypothetical protein